MVFWLKRLLDLKFFHPQQLTISHIEKQCPYMTGTEWIRCDYERIPGLKRMNPHFVLPDSSESIGLIKINYDNKNQEDIVSKLFSLSTDGKYDEPREDLILGNLDRYSMLFKNSDFENEQEWRIIALQPKNTSVHCYRTDKDIIIPYREFYLPEKQNLGIKKIILGPKSQVNLQVFKYYLEEKDFDISKIDITQSETTYR
jgi:hypothetical protein